MQVLDTHQLLFQKCKYSTLERIYCLNFRRIHDILIVKNNYKALSSTV